MTSIENVVAARAERAITRTPVTAVAVGPRRVRVTAPDAQDEFAFEALDMIELPGSDGAIQVRGCTATITW